MYVKRMPKNLCERKIVASDNRTTYGLKLYQKDYPGAVWEAASVGSGNIIELENKK